MVIERARRAVYLNGKALRKLVYDTLLARGKIDADTAARGGRGMESWMSMMSHLDSRDVLGPYDLQAFEVEDRFDVPIGK